MRAIQNRVGKPVVVSGNAGEYADINIQNQQFLQRYRLLASLFADESEGRFTTEHFGFLTPHEARQKYKDSYKKRFDAHFGRVLGGFLQQLPPVYQQQ